jgi:hypothetical protein
MKLNARKILAVLMATAMVFTFAACNGDDNNGGNAASTTTGSATSGTEPTGAGADEDLVFDFGVIAFTPREFSIVGDDVKIGGNSAAGRPGEGGGGERAIRIFNFHGYTMPAEGYPDYNDGSFHDPDGVYASFISQNGKFWENVNKIEASFFLKNLCDLESEYLTNVMGFMQNSGAMNWSSFRMDSSNNLIDQVMEREDREYEFGDIMHATWDITEAKNTPAFASVNRMCEEAGEMVQDYVFDVVASEENDWKGGGVGKFGLVIQNAHPIDEFDMSIHWTDAKIYVYDLELYFDFVEQIEEITGKDFSDMKDRVIEVS